MVTDFNKTELKNNKLKVYIKVNLTANTEYTFWCISDGAGSFDEYLWLYDKNNNCVASNDDTDGGSRFTYTPDTTEDFIIVLGSYSGNSTGKFSEITVTPAPNTGNITPIITVTTPVTLTGTQNTAITNIQLVANINVSGQPTFSCSDLPAGLTLSNIGLISGTPTNYGSGSSTITVSYTGAENKTIILNWNIAEASSTDNINGELTESGSYLASNFENDDFNGTYTYYFTDSSGIIYFTNGKSGIMGPSYLLRENDRFILKYDTDMRCNVYTIGTIAFSSFC